MNGDETTELFFARFAVADCNAVARFANGTSVILDAVSNGLTNYPAGSRLHLSYSISAAVLRASNCQQKRYCIPTVLHSTIDWGTMSGIGRFFLAVLKVLMPFRTGQD